MKDNGVVIYVVGGFDGVEYFNSCRKFYTAKKMWTEAPPMNSKRCYVSAVALQGKIYVRVALMGTIYICGGFNGQECLNSAEYYDPVANQWTLIAPMRNRRSGVGVIAYHGQVYALGGFNGITRMNTGERYCPKSRTWTTIPEMYSPRSNFAVGVIDDLLFTIGGFNGVTTISQVECYDSDVEECVSVSVIMIVVSGHGVIKAFRYLNFVYDNTICEMWRPHLVIYLDAPVDYVRKQITRRANLWEVGSPIITDEFLKLVETTYKEKYLPQMRKYSDVMTVDMVDLPDWDMLIEDLEKRDLDTQPFDEDDKFKDWQSEFEDDFNRMRMDLAKKWQVENRFSMALPYDAPELIVHIDDYPIYKKIVEEHPEVKYRPGYNPDKYNVMLKW
nr:hypothetical protein BaRGS_008358 [Batillaria attramentaria]